MDKQLPQSKLLWENGIESPLKPCNKCGEIFPLSKFYRDKSQKDGLQNHCKECDKKLSKEFYKNNSEYFKMYKMENGDHIRLYARIYNFLHGREGRRGGYFEGTGICVFCGEINPFLLLLHHPFGLGHPLKIHECADCHCLQHRFSSMLEVTL